MKVTTEALERCEVLMTVEVEPSEEQEMLKKAAKRIAREVRIPGFRPGKAPYNTVVRRFGIETVQQNALEASAEKVIEEALKQTELKPIAQISVDEVSWNPLTLKIKVPGPPQIELGDYRSLRLESQPVEVTAEDIDKELQTLQEQNATWAPVERPAQLGDLITMSVVEKAGDEVLAEHDSVEYELRLSEATAQQNDKAGGKQPDLTTPLLGLSAGQEKSFTVVYPQDYENERYAGQEITFTVKASSVKEKELDALDDDFAQAVGDFETLDDLKERIQTTLRDRREIEAKQKLGQAMLDKIIEGAEKIDWPVAFEEAMIDDELERMSQQFNQSGLNLDSYLKIEKKSKETLREEIRANSMAGLRRSIVLGEVARLEKLSVSNSEILERAKVIADVFGPSSEQIWQHLISSEAQQNRMANEVLTTKTLLRLAEIAKGEAPELEAETPAEAVAEPTPAEDETATPEGAPSEEAVKTEA